MSNFKQVVKDILASAGIPYGECKSLPDGRVEVRRFNYGSMTPEEFAVAIERALINRQVYARVRGEQGGSWATHKHLKAIVSGSPDA